MQDFPFLKFKGKPVELGFKIGETFGQNIRTRIKSVRESTDYPVYLERLKPYVKYSQEYFPRLVEQVQATAEGAQVAFEDCFLLNTHEVYHRAKPWRTPVEEDHCTSFVTFVDGKTIVGHNEDWVEEEIGDLYILQAEVDGVAFLGLQYCTELPGSAVGFNSYGLVQCINDLNCFDRFGVPRSFVSAALTTCKTLTEAENIIRKVRHASGFNHILVQGSDVWNFEIAADLIGIDKFKDKCFVHTNHCLCGDVLKNEESHTPCSEDRYTKARELVTDKMSLESIKEALDILKAQNFKECVTSQTLASVIVDPEAKEIRVRRINGGNGYTTYKM